MAAGPSGAPARGRTDVLPTGRNLYTADPRTMPTPTAIELGRAAADEVLRRYMQEHGERPRSLVIDLWGSATLRTGGEEIAQGLALMGCRPGWDAATGRVTGVEVLPPAVLGRAARRRDLAHLRPVPRHVPDPDRADRRRRRRRRRRDEEGDENPLAARPAAAARPAPHLRLLARRLRRGPGGLCRRRLASARRNRPRLSGRGLPRLWRRRRRGRAAPGAFAGRVAEADLLVHAGDDPGRDLLEGSADVAFVGGFAAALAALGGKADVIMLDTTDPARPRARSLAEAVARIVRARAVNPRFIDGQMRHGPRGAAEFAETVDRLIGFAETTSRAAAADRGGSRRLSRRPRGPRLPAARKPRRARAIAERFAAARRRGLWHARRNAVDDELAALIAEAREREAA